MKVTNNTHYFLSNFYDIDGAVVRTISDVDKEDRVSVLILSPIGNVSTFYTVQTTIKVNQYNLYDNLHSASASHRFRKFSGNHNKCTCP